MDNPTKHSKPNLTEIYPIRRIEKIGDQLNVQFVVPIAVKIFCDYITELYAAAAGQVVYAKDCTPTACIAGSSLKRFEVRLLENRETGDYTTLFAMYGISEVKQACRTVQREQATENEFGLLQSTLESLVR